MKKHLMAFCGAALALAAVAAPQHQPPAQPHHPPAPAPAPVPTPPAPTPAPVPTPPPPAPVLPKVEPAKRMAPQRYQFVIDDSLTPARAEEIKREMCMRFDAAVEAYRHKPPHRDGKKAPVRVVLRIDESRAGAYGRLPGAHERKVPGKAAHDGVRR